MGCAISTARRQGPNQGRSRTVCGWPDRHLYAERLAAQAGRPLPSYIWETIFFQEGIYKIPNAVDRAVPTAATRLWRIRDKLPDWHSDWRLQT